MFLYALGQLADRAFGAQRVSGGRSGRGSASRCKSEGAPSAPLRRPSKTHISVLDPKMAGLHGSRSGLRGFESGLQGSGSRLRGIVGIHPPRLPPPAPAEILEAQFLKSEAWSLKSRAWFLMPRA